MYQIHMFLLLLSAAPALMATALAPDDVVRETSNEVLLRLDADRNRLEQDPSYINTIVRELVVPHFDFVTMAQVTISKHWQALDESERTCYTRGFRNLLVERYADVLLSYNQQSLTYDPAKPVGELGYMSVRQTISRESDRPLPVDYPMHQTDHGWQVIDLVIDGISLLKSYNRAFEGEISELGLDEFIHSFPECSEVN